MTRYSQLLAMLILVPWFATKPVPLIVLTPDPYQSAEFRQAFFEASRVYGKGNCGDIKLAEMTARHSVRTNVPANLIASIVVVESACNPLAINKVTGDIGVMQIDLSAHNKEYDFQTINLFNAEANMQIGSDILAASIKVYGIRKGIGRYNGVGPNMDAYSERVLSLAGPLRKDLTAVPKSVNLNAGDTKWTEKTSVSNAVAEHSLTPATHTLISAPLALKPSLIPPRSDTAVGLKNKPTLTGKPTAPIFLRLESAAPIVKKEEIDDPTDGSVQTH